MKILKYIQYRMQGLTKEESYMKMAIRNECTFEEYKKMFDKKVKVGEKDVSDKRNRGHKRKANRT